MIILIGSRAANYYYAEGDRREAKDWDVIGSYDEIVKFGKSFNKPFQACYPINEGKTLLIRMAPDIIIEGSITWDDSLAAEFADLIKSDHHARQYNGMIVPSLDVLYMLKKSHRYLRNSPSFKKTMDDIHLMRKYGAIIPVGWQEHYKRREKEQYNYKHPKLDVTKGDFFNGDGVNYVYDHDTIHEAMKHLDYPAYQYFKPENSQVMVSKVMWNELDDFTRLLSVLEEAYVLAIERSQVPYPDTDPTKSFLMALSKVCTSITSGWWREYAWEHYYQVLELFDPKYMDKFRRGVNEGIVKPYDPVKGMY